ncbi:hypothetical protein HMPREF0578_1160 [Mobiluncus mulieris 28-1]|nr:hypothetical protein HMPREF0578_1160 [Mobiluncus mulieris 28-1]
MVAIIAPASGYRPAHPRGDSKAVMSTVSLVAEIRGYLWWRLDIFEPHPHFSRYFCHLSS